jgi:hypothetical protein
MNEKDLLPEREAIRKMFQDANPESVKSLQGLVDSGKMVPYAKVGKEEPMIIVAMPWADRNIRGCVRDACESCEADVPLAPSSQEMIAKHTGPISVICLSCVRKLMEAGQTPEGESSPSQ